MLWRWSSQLPGLRQLHIIRSHGADANDHIVSAGTVTSSSGASNGTSGDSDTDNDTGAGNSTTGGNGTATALGPGLIYLNGTVQVCT